MFQQGFQHPVESFGAPVFISFSVSIRGNFRRRGRQNRQHLSKKSRQYFCTVCGKFPRVRHRAKRPREQPSDRVGNGMAERSESHRGTMSHNNSICKFRNYSRDSSLAAHDFSTKFRRHLFYRGQPSPAFRDAESVRRQLYKGGMLTGVRDAAAGRSPQVIGSKAGDSVLNFLPFL